MVPDEQSRLALRAKYKTWANKECKKRNSKIGLKRSALVLANSRLDPFKRVLFPNEASNYQFGGQFAAVAGFVLNRAREKGLGRDLPAEWFAQTLLP